MQYRADCWARPRLRQRIAEELAPATAAVLNAETPALEKALHRAGVDANPFTVAARQADLLVVEDPAWVEMPAQLPGQVLLVFTGSNVAEGWAEELARRGYYRDFRWRSRGRAQQSAALHVLLCFLCFLQLHSDFSTSLGHSAAQTHFYKL